MVRIYYNPIKNKLALGVFYTFSDIRYCLLVEDLGNDTYETLDITDNWLDGWEYIGEYGQNL